MFRTQHHAEESAYHSARAWAANQKNGTVKTLLLPNHHNHNTSDGTSSSSYGFVAGGGTLFWVRRVQATWIGGESSISNNLLSAHVILTQGVIGGTGNRNSRRGTEIASGRVFCGEGSGAHAWRVCQHMQQQSNNHTMSPALHHELALVAIGKPDEYQSTLFLQEWPAHVLQPTSIVSANDNNNVTEDPQKRALQELTVPTSQNFATNNWRQQQDATMLVDHQLWMPDAKRRRCGGIRHWQNDVAMDI